MAFVGRKMHREHKDVLRKKETGWEMGNLNTVKLKEYNSLYDPNMRHFFENKKVQTLLYSTGQIDRHGRVIDLDKNKSKLHVLEREFSRAETIEERRQKDELEMRYRVQRKRFNELEKLRNEEILHKLKHDRELSKEIINTMRSSTNNSVTNSKANSRSRAGQMMQESSVGSTAQDMDGGMTPYDRAGMMGGGDSRDRDMYLDAGY